MAVGRSNELDKFWLMCTLTRRTMLHSWVLGECWYDISVICCYKSAPGVFVENTLMYLYSSSRLRRSCWPRIVCLSLFDTVIMMSKRAHKVTELNWTAIRECSSVYFVRSVRAKLLSTTEHVERAIFRVLPLCAQICFFDVRSPLRSRSLHRCADAPLNVLQLFFTDLLSDNIWSPTVNRRSMQAHLFLTYVGSMALLRLLLPVTLTMSRSALHLQRLLMSASALWVAMPKTDYIGAWHLQIIRFFTVSAPGLIFRSLPVCLRAYGGLYKDDIVCRSVS